MAKIEMIGKRFGRLTVIAEGEKPSKKSEFHWVCQCDCGNITKPIRGSTLRLGRSQSCGCYQLECARKTFTKHGLYGSRICRIYYGMKYRCYSRSASNYNRYGGRGITVCDDWLNDFRSFYDWAMSHGYDDNLTLDRIDVNGDYCPENCRWATQKEQGNNRRNNVFLEINGETKTIAQWADESCVPHGTIYYRFKKGITAENMEEMLFGSATEEI